MQLVIKHNEIQKKILYYFYRLIEMAKTKEFSRLARKT
jgi:hypothetical protein